MQHSSMFQSFFFFKSYVKHQEWCTKCFFFNCTSFGGGYFFPTIKILTPHNYTTSKWKLFSGSTNCRVTGAFTIASNFLKRLKSTHHTLCTLLYACRSMLSAWFDRNVVVVMSEAPPPLFFFFLSFLFLFLHTKAGDADRWGFKTTLLLSTSVTSVSVSSQIPSLPSNRLLMCFQRPSRSSHPHLPLFCLSSSHHLFFFFFFLLHHSFVAPFSFLE